MIYKLETDFDQYYSFYLDPEDLFGLMPNYSPRYRATPKLDGWVAPKGEYYRSENYAVETKVIPDLALWGMGNIVLSDKAYRTLAQHLAHAGEFLPLIVEGRRLYMFNTLQVLSGDSVDNTCAVDVIDSGVHLGKVGMKISEKGLKNVDIFKLNENKLVHSFVTDGFKRLSESAGLTGLNFININGVLNESF